MKVTIIGLGLIGGSIAKDLRSSCFATTVYGFDTNYAHIEQAQELGLIDASLKFENILKASDIVIIAIPVNAGKECLIRLLDQHINERVLIVDMGSTKAGICKSVAAHPKRSHYVAMHPIAGTENTGPNAAVDKLFDNKVGIICDEALSGTNELALGVQLLEALNMNVHYMDSNEHDKHIAYVSHLSHISSFTLGLTVLEMEKDEEAIFNMAGSGFGSTVRLAKSSAKMWSPIFEQNADCLLPALDGYIQQLQSFRKMIAEKDTNGLTSAMNKANDIRRILNGIELKEK